MEHSNWDLAGIVSSIALRCMRQITIAFIDPVSDTGLRSTIESKAWEEFDNAITLLAEQTLNSGQRLQLELRICGKPSTGLFDLVFPGFIESGDLKVVKMTYIVRGLVVCLLHPAERDNQFLLAFISDPSTHGLRHG